MFNSLNKGISTPIAIAIILSLAVLVGGITLWQYSEIEKEPVGLETSGKNENTVWKIYNSEENGITVEHPPEWIIIKEDEEFVVFADGKEVGAQAEKRDGEIRSTVGIFFYDNNESLSLYDWAIKEWGKPESFEAGEMTKVKIGDLEGLKYKFVNMGVETHILFSKNDKIIDIQTMFDNYDDSYMIFDRILSTLQFENIDNSEDNVRIARENEEWFIFRNEVKIKKFSTCWKIKYFTLSPDNKHVAYTFEEGHGVNMQVLALDDYISGHYSILDFAFSPTSDSFVYRTTGEECLMMIVLSKEEGLDVWREDLNISFSDTLLESGFIDQKPVFSPNGKHLAYIKYDSSRMDKNKGLCWSVVLDGKESIGYNSVREVAFSPDGKYFTYKAEINNELRWIINKVGGGEKNIEAFIPEDWKLIAKVEGNLNQDNMADAAAVIEYESLESNESPVRRLLIAFQKDNGNYELSIQSDKAILRADEGGAFGDPFNALEVNRGSLLIKFHGGSTWRWSKAYRFRYQDNGWYLIGSTLTDYYATNADKTVITKDYNLLTDQLKITDNKGVKWINQGERKLVNLKDFSAYLLSGGKAFVERTEKKKEEEDLEEDEKVTEILFRELKEGGNKIGNFIVKKIDPTRDGKFSEEFRFDAQENSGYGFHSISTFNYMNKVYLIKEYVDTITRGTIYSYDIYSLNESNGQLNLISSFSTHRDGHFMVFAYEDYLYLKVLSAGPCGGGCFSEDVRILSFKEDKLKEEKNFPSIEADDGYDRQFYSAPSLSLETKNGKLYVKAVNNNSVSDFYLLEDGNLVKTSF